MLSYGKIVQVSGPVVDCEFQEGQLPKIREALRVQVEDEVRTMEVAQHMDEHTVRCIMLAPSEGLSRGLNGGSAGDVYVTVEMMSHPLFEREGSDIYCDIPITYAQAVLGAEITVPTIDGDVKYTIPEGTQSGTKFRLRGKGVKLLRRDARGDQYVTVNVEVPKKLSKKQKELLQDFDNSLDEKNHSKRENFFDKLKQLRRK